MIIKIKKLDKKASIPTQARKGDFCYDVVATSEEEVAPNVWRYGLGFALEIDRTNTEFGKIWTETVPYKSNPNYNVPHVCNWVDGRYKDLKLSIDFRPRSSVWKTGMILSNCQGTIDEFYRGEVMAVFYHVMPKMPRYKIGDRIGQIKLGITLPLEFEESEIDMNTERGTGGFGSTNY